MPNLHPLDGSQILAAEWENVCGIAFEIVCTVIKEPSTAVSLLAEHYDTHIRISPCASDV